MLEKQYKKEYESKGYPKLPDNPKSKSACLAFLKFFDAHNVKPIAPERRVVSLKYKYGGTVDLIAMIGIVKKEGLPLENGEKHDWWLTSNSRQEYTCEKTGRVVEMKLCIGDYKTSNQVDGKAEYAEQVVAYGDAVCEMCDNDFKFQEHIVVQLFKDKPEFKAFRVKNPSVVRKSFRKKVDLFYAYKEITEPFETLVKKKIINFSSTDKDGFKEI